MSLVRYKQKRDFTSTTEPEGGKAKSKQLIFVIQKHAASRLHYDFRLEMEGVLKSCAVTKGPSTDPSVKRLAMFVEDHPYNYRDFEGTIPEGNYGAGTVIVWDEGTYEPLDKIEGKKAQDKHLLKQLKAGSIKIVMHGKKMKGEWALVRTHQSENSWLLIKHRDKYASPTDITLKEKSVVSGKTLEQIERAMSKNGAKKSTTVKKSTVGKSTAKKSVAKKATAKKSTAKIAATKSKSSAKSATKKTIVKKSTAAKSPVAAKGTKVSGTKSAASKKKVRS